MNFRSTIVRGLHHLGPVWLWLLAIGLGLVLVGCGPGPAPTTPPAPAQRATPTLAERPATPTSVPPSATPKPTRSPSVAPSETPVPTGVPSPSPIEELAPTQAAGAYSFAADVLPIFVARCIKCHSGDNPPRGLRLDSYENVMAGSSQRQVVIPGNPEDSQLVKRIKGIARPPMPFDGPPFLSDEQMAIIEAWIADGAPNN
jgi:hypothetical protein